MFVYFFNQWYHCFALFLDGEYKFSVDRNGLTLNKQHPLVIIYNLKDSPGVVKIEEYIFFRTEEYPTSILDLKSVKLPPRE